MIRAVALLLTLLTGFSGLVYEVTWQKYLATLLGSHSKATAAVLGIFLGGLSIGYAVFGAVTQRIMRRAARDGSAPRLLSVYGAVEASIGVYALLFPLLFRAANAASLFVPHAAGGLGFAFDVALTALLLGPPTVLMGGTIPLLTQALSSGVRDATRFHALVYASNTAGAFCGSLAAGFVLVPRLGLDAVMLWMGLVNLVAGGSFLLLGRQPRFVPARAVAPAAPRTVAGFAAFAAAALLSGFAMMAIQMILNRIGGLSLGASHFTFAMVVAVFVLCIAIGSFTVSALPRIPVGTVVGVQWVMILLLVVLYTQISNAPYWAHVIRTGFGKDPQHFESFYLAIFGWSLLVLAVPIGLSGALLPLLFHTLRREVGELGVIAGRLYSWNTVGSLLGALVGGYLLLFWLDLHQVFRIALVALACAALLLSARLLSPVWVAVSALAFAATLALVVVLPPWDQHALTADTFRVRGSIPETKLGPAAFYESRSKMGKVLFYDDDPTLTVSVRDLAIGSLGLYTNGKPDSALPRELPTVVLLGVLPCLFADQCESAFVIGLGTGATAGSLAKLDEMKRVVVAEISPGVVRALPLFAEHNEDAGNNPRIEIRMGDAYRTLLRDDARYDVIVSEPSNPWVSGVENLYSREFLLAAKQRLTPGGVYAQWFHGYESSRETVELVLRTYVSVFDAVAVWRSMAMDLILIGWNRSDHAVDLGRFEARMQKPGFAAQLERIELADPLSLFEREVLPLGAAQAAVGSGETISLLRPILSHRAARDFFVDADAAPVSTAPLEAARAGVRNSLLRRYIQRLGGQFSEEQRAQLVMETCDIAVYECITWLGWWAADDPKSEALQAVAHQLIEDDKVSEHAIDEVEQFYYPTYRKEEGKALPLPEVKRLVDLFEWFHLPSNPFRRSSLLAVLDRCQDTNQGVSCSEVRHDVETKLGDLSIEAVGGGVDVPGGLLGPIR